MKNEFLLDRLKGMNVDFLSTVLDFMPIEFSIIDADDKVLFWNRHGVRIFKRGPAVLGRNVKLCHPGDSIDKVEQVIDALRSGKKDHIDFWMNLPDGDEPRKLLIRYIAIRDDNDNYLGVLETTINLTPLQKFEGENRLGDFKPE